MSLFAKRLTHESEENVRVSSQFELIRSNASGVGVGVSVSEPGLAGRGGPQKRGERDVHVSQPVVDVSDRGLSLVKLEVGDVRAEDEQETDDGAADGVRSV